MNPDFQFEEASFSDVGEIFARVALRNNTPLEEFLGLTPTEMYRLLYEPFGPDAPFGLRRADDEILNRIPFFRLCEEILHMVAGAETFRLTQKGNIPPKQCRELYSMNLMYDEMISSGVSRLHREDASITIPTARFVCTKAGLLLKRRNVLSVTKKAARMLAEGDRNGLFLAVFQTFTMTYLWASQDLYPDSMAGQLGFTFSLAMLSKFGSEARTTEYYARLYERAFPMFLPAFRDYPYGSPSTELGYCYDVRVFMRFFSWFNFIETVEPERWMPEHHEGTYRKSDIVDKLFILPELSDPVMPARP